MARPRQVPQAPCPNPAHRGSSIRGRGTFIYNDRVSQRYECRPKVGARHSFSVVISDADETRRPYAPPPPCPRHPGSRVHRAGKYGRKTPSQRQLYRCFPPDGSKSHKFTPPLPRDHVHVEGEACVLCEEKRGVHRGETAAARGHSWPTRVVAQALERMANGASYGDTGRWAIGQVGLSVRQPRRRSSQGAVIGAASPTPTPSPPLAAPSPATSSVPTVARPAVPIAPGAAPISGTPKPRSRPARESHAVWHIGADWVEAFGPVIWAPVEARMREAALGERARLDALISSGRHLDRPQVWLLDDVPIYGRDAGSDRARRDAGFYLLVIAEVAWEEPDPLDPLGLPVARQQLRLVRAMPKSNTQSWRICFTELGYEPDWVVADAGTGIGAAITTHFRAGRTRFVPSAWHMQRAIEQSLLKTTGAFTASSQGRELVEPLREHLRLLYRGSPVLTAASEWRQWWDDLEGMLSTQGLPLVKVHYGRRNYERDMAAVISDLVAAPAIPVSTGGLEKLISKHLDPVLAQRRASFGNIERTNTLFDLVVAKTQGAFDRQANVVKLLRADALAHGGYTVALRQVADPQPVDGRYASLRDATLLPDLAARMGIG